MLSESRVASRKNDVNNSKIKSRICCVVIAWWLHCLSASPGLNTGLKLIMPLAMSLTLCVLFFCFFYVSYLVHPHHWIWQGKLLSCTIFPFFFRCLQDCQLLIFFPTWSATCTMPQGVIVYLWRVCGLNAYCKPSLLSVYSWLLRKFSCKRCIITRRCSRID